MARQFEKVDCSRGAPMGRASWGSPQYKRNVRLFKVRLDSGGYDDGGAYWGSPGTLYCAAEGEAYRAFVRAKSRVEAADELGITEFLRKPV